MDSSAHAMQRAIPAHTRPNAVSADECATKASVAAVATFWSTNAVRDTCVMGSDSQCIAVRATVCSPR